MKKLMFLSIALLSAGIYAQDQIQEDLRIIDFVRGDTPFYKDPRVQKAAAIGAAPTALLGGGLGAAIAYDLSDNQNPTGGAPSNPTDPISTSKSASLGASIGGAIGGGVGTLVGGLNRSISIERRQRDINRVLQKHTNGLYKFQHLTKPQAILIYAAYRQNLPRLQRWAPSQKDFLNKKGIMQTIAELFYKVSESTIDDDLRTWEREYRNQNPRISRLSPEYFQASEMKENEIRKSHPVTQDQVKALYDEMTMSPER